MRSDCCIRLVVVWTAFIAIGSSLEPALGQSQPASRREKLRQLKEQGTKERQEDEREQERRRQVKEQQAKERRETAAAERDKATAPMVQPIRAPLAPLDLADADACIRELAELASFGYILNDLEGWRSNAVGWFPPGYPDNLAALDYAARFSRLAGTPHEDIRALSERVRRLWENSWRLGWVEQDFGMTWNKAMSLNGAKLLASFGYVVAKDVGVTQMRERTYGPAYRDAYGLYHQEVTISDEPSALERVADRLLPQALDALEADESNWKRVSSEASTARGMLEDQLAELWKTELLPRLQGQANGGAKTLISAGNAQDIMRDERLHDTSFIDFGRTAFRNASGGDLTHVAAELVMTDNFGDSCSWYAYFPKLGADDACLTLPMGTFYALQYQFAREIRATITIAASEGSQTIEATHRRTDVGVEGAKRTDAELAAYHGQLTDCITRMIGPASKMLSILPRLYGVPRDPVAARAALEHAVTIGQTYSIESGDLAGRIPVRPESVVFDAPGPASNLFTATLTLSTPAGPMNRQVFGRVEEEPERGCVLVLNTTPMVTDALQRVRDAEREQRQKELDEKAKTRPRPSGNAGRPASLQPNTKRPGFFDTPRLHAPTDLEAWKRREVWLATSPRDKLGVNDPSPFSLAARTTPPKEYQSAVAKRTVFIHHAEDAQFIIFVDPSGKLALDGLWPGGSLTLTNAAP